MHGRPFRVAVVLLVAAVLLAMPTGLASQDEPPKTGTVEESGFCSNPASDAAGAVWEHTYDWSDMTILGVKLTLTWTDDEGTRSRPDGFEVSASDAEGASDTDSGTGGSLALSLAQGPYNGTWTVRVECTEAGSTPVGPIGIISRTDPGNSWSFVLEYTYTEAPADGGPPELPANVREVLESPIFMGHIALMISSTIGFLVAGGLAGVYLVTRSKWATSASKLQRLLASPRPYRSLAPHVWFAFFIASVPIGIWVAGKFYGWANAWTSLPVVWNPGFWNITNADHSSLLVMFLWALPMWLNRREILTRDPHVRWWRWSAWMRRRAERAPPPRFTDREMALIYFFLGVLVFFLFMVQPHGN